LGDILVHAIGFGCGGPEGKAREPQIKPPWVRRFVQKKKHEKTGGWQKQKKKNWVLEESVWGGRNGNRNSKTCSKMWFVNGRSKADRGGKMWVGKGRVPTRCGRLQLVVPRKSLKKKRQGFGGTRQNNDKGHCQNRVLSVG